MFKTNTQQGFIPLLILVIVAAAAIGGGVYYSKHKAPAAPSTETSATAQGDVSATTGSTNANADANGSLSLKATSLRSLVALGGNQKCTVTSTGSGNSTAGTVYLNGSLMRGDFNSQMNGSATESHLINKEGSTYVWSGNQGAKMEMAAMMDSSASSQNSGQVNLDQNVEYHCEAWTPSAEQFTAPSTVKFMDLGAMMKAGADAKAVAPAATVNAVTGIKVNAAH